MKYAHLNAGGDIEAEFNQLPHGWRNGEVGPKPNNLSLTELKAHGWLPIEIVRDPVDPATHKLGPMQETIEADRVLRHFPAVPLSAAELTAKAADEDRGSIGGLDIQVRVLTLEFLRAIASTTNPTFEANLPQKIKDVLAVIDAKKGNIF